MEDEFTSIEKEIISQKIMIAVIQESGEVTWITSDEPTKYQQKQFKKIYAVTHNPSFVMNIILFIEIMILNLLYVFENFKNGEE